MNAAFSPKLFSFDIGTNSIGWCVFDLDENGDPDSLTDAGVRIFSDGREPKSGTSLAEGRRMARAMSRRRDRYKRRRKAVLRTLTAFGLMPDDERARKTLLTETSDRAPDQVATDVYALRSRALDEKLPLFHLGRVLFHLNQRRGFKSNRKTDRRDNDQGKIAIGVGRLDAAMRADKARTLGEFLAKRRAAGQHVRVRAGSAPQGADDKDGYDFYPERGFLEREFNAVWNAQAAYYPEILTEDRREHLFKVMFYQRPLKPALVGKCSLNPDELRLAKTHPLFQRFRLFKEINELTVIDEWQRERKLSIEERDRLVNQLKQQQSATYPSLRKTLKLPRGSRFKKETAAREKMKGDEIYAAMSDKSRFGSRWPEFSLEEQWTIIEHLKETEDPLALMEWLEVTYELTGEKRDAIASVHLPEGYGRLGETALSQILEELINGRALDDSGREVPLVEYDALQRVLERHPQWQSQQGGYDADQLPKYQDVLHRRIPPGTGDPKDPFDVEMGRITNPTVHIGLNQLQQVTNRLIKRYGRPAQIAIELARDLKLNDEQKKEINRTIARNTRAAEQRSKKLRDIGQPDTGFNRNLLKLWEELNPDKPEDRCCIYTGTPISIGMLFSGAVDVDHILPWSQTLDDSQSNRILCLREANREKGNRAPADVATWSAHYDEILERANRLPQNKRWRFAQDAMAKYEGERDFLARQLTDTQYLSRMAHEYLGALFPDEEPDEWGVFHRRNHIRVLPGRLTEMLRRTWHLNDLLPDHNYGETVKGKNRKDHRHHAIDAAVAGVTTRRLLQEIASAAGRGEAVGHEDALRKFALPWPNFRQDLQKTLDRIIVSHKPDHGTLPKPGQRGQTAGQLHNDTAYGITGEVDKKGNTIVVRRKPFMSLTEKDIPAIRDVELRTELFSAIGGLSGKELTEALLRFQSDNKRFKGIRRVRMTEPLSVIPIADKNGLVYKGYKGDANYRYDVWELENGKWVAEVVTMFDAHQPGWTSKVLTQNHNPRKVLSLHQNDMVAYEHPHDGYTVGRVVKFGSSGQLTLAGNREGGKLKYRDADKNDPFKYFYKSGGALKDVKLRQIRVDETGRVFDPGPQDRESRLTTKNTLRR